LNAGDERGLKFRDFLMSMAEYVTCFMIFYLVRIGVHEWFHLETAILFGGEGYIIKTFFGALTVFTKMPRHPTVVAFAGGLGLGAIFFALAYWDWHDWDIEECAALLPHAFSETAYGIFEGLFLPIMGFWGAKLTIEQFLQYASIIGLAGWLVGLLIGWYLWLKTAEWLKSVTSTTEVCGLTD